jgi:hypothetical protein
MLVEWVAVNTMKINPCKYKAVCFTRIGVKDPVNYVRGPINSGSEQLSILGNNRTQRHKLGCSLQLHGEKGLKGTTFHRGYIQKGE